MSYEADRAFIDYLYQLNQRDRGAMAALRHSLAFEPGDYPRAYPIVERFVAKDWHAQDSRRLARYAVAALLALHPTKDQRTLAAALGRLQRDSDRPSLERRFLALLEADGSSLLPHLRQAVSLLASSGLGFDHARLLSDLSVLLNDRGIPDALDRVRRHWARDFYRAVLPDDPDAKPNAVGDVTPPTITSE